MTAYTEKNKIRFRIDQLRANPSGFVIY